MTLPPITHRFCVAPMMDWSDRHCRALHRVLTRHALLYTEMVTTGALLHGDVARHLAHEDDAPVALQIGGSEPSDVAAAARLAQAWGYDEVNLNCGCPSERVQRGVRSRAFDHGVFPAKDAWVYEFDQRYLRDVETA